MVAGSNTDRRGELGVVGHGNAKCRLLFHFVEPGRQQAGVRQLQGYCINLTVETVAPGGREWWGGGGSNGITGVLMSVVLLASRGC